MNECPLRFSCIEGEDGYCENHDYCLSLAAPLRLPFYYENGNLIVGGWYGSYRKNTLEDLKQAGWSLPEDLPYRWNGCLQALETIRHNDSGFAPAIADYSPLRYFEDDGLSCLKVVTTYCHDTERREYIQHNFAVATPLPFYTYTGENELRLFVRTCNLSSKEKTEAEKIGWKEAEYLPYEWDEEKRSLTVLDINLVEGYKKAENWDTYSNFKILKDGCHYKEIGCNHEGFAKAIALNYRAVKKRGYNKITVTKNTLGFAKAKSLKSKHSSK